MAPATDKPKETPKLTEAALSKRAASRGYTLEKENGSWFAEIGGTRYGPMQSLEELDEFLPKEG